MHINSISDFLKLGFLLNVWLTFQFGSLETDLKTLSETSDKPDEGEFNTN